MEVFFTCLTTFFKKLIFEPSCAKIDFEHYAHFGYPRWKTPGPPWPSASGDLTTRQTIFCCSGTCPLFGKFHPGKKCWGSWSAGSALGHPDPLVRGTDPRIRIFSFLIKVLSGLKKMLAELILNQNFSKKRLMIMCLQLIYKNKNMKKVTKEKNRIRGWNRIRTH